MKSLGYYNGRFGELDEMMIPMNDRVCYFGDGVYEASMCRNYNIFALDEHVDRIYRSAAMLRIDPGMEKDEMKDVLVDMVRRIDSPDSFVYWQLTRGTGPRLHAFLPDTNANFWITVTPREMADLTVKTRLITLEDTRFLHCNIKTVNLIPTVMASQKAKEAGCREAVLHRDGRVTEGAHSNVHILKDGALYTAPADNLILAGITRAHIINICKKLGIPVYEVPFTVEEMMKADEVFTSSSSAICLVAEAIDGTPVGGKAPGLITRIRDELYAEYIRETE